MRWLKDMVYHDQGTEEEPLIVPTTGTTFIYSCQQLMQSQPDTKNSPFCGVYHW